MKSINKQITQGQEEVLKFFRQFVEQNKRPPTLSEIKEALNLPYHSSARQILIALQRKGYLQHSGERWARSAWELVDKGNRDVSLGDQNAGTILSLADVVGKKEVPISLGEPWMNDLLGGGLYAGGLLLLAGDPGIGKTTLILQLASGLGAKQTESLILLSEQTIGELRRRAEVIEKNKELFKFIRVVEGKYVEKLEEIFDQMERPGSELNNVKVIFVDSIQGLGLVSSHRQRWEPFFKLLKRAKNRRVAVVLIGHVTKLGSMAGPRALEHEVDVFIHAKKLVDFRVFFVPKNRFGASNRILLQMNSHGVLEPVVKSGAPVQVAIAKSCTWDVGFVEVQARVEATPWLGSGRQIPSGGVTRKQLVKVMGILKNLGFDFLSLQTEVQALISGSQAGAPPELDTPLAISLVASYLQREVPVESGFSGELDLMGNIITPLQNPNQTQAAKLRDQLAHAGIKQLYCLLNMAQEVQKVNMKIKPIVVRNIKEILQLLWKDLHLK